MKKFFFILAMVLCIGLLSSCQRSYAFYEFEYEPNAILEAYLDDYTNDVQYQKNLKVLLDSAPGTIPSETVNYISEDISLILLYSYNVGIYDKTYRYPTVENPNIAVAEWPPLEVSPDAHKYHIFLTTEDSETYKVSFSSSIVDSIVRTSDEKMIFFGGAL